MGPVLWERTDLLSSHRNTGRKGTIRDILNLRYRKRIFPFAATAFIRRRAIILSFS